MGKADRQAPGPRIVTPPEIINLSHRVIGDLVIIFELVGDLCHPCPGDGSHIVIPPVDPLARFAIIRRPAEIRRVDIRGQPLFEPVQLIGTDKMHLARQTGLVAGTAQMVRVGRNGRRELGCIVVDARDAGQLAGHERCPPRRAKRRSGIGVCKTRGPGRKRLEVRGMQPVGRSVGEQGAVQLIHHEYQDVGLGHAASLISWSSARRIVTIAAFAVMPSPKAARRYRPSIRAASICASASADGLSGRKAWRRLLCRRR